MATLTYQTFVARVPEATRAPGSTVTALVAEANRVVSSAYGDAADDAACAYVHWKLALTEFGRKQGMNPALLFEAWKVLRDGSVMGGPS